MNKLLKYSLWILAAIAVLFVAAVAIITLTFDPNAYKAKIQEVVKEKTGRTLTLAGDIGLTFFPTLGVNLGNASLSERNSQQTFASVKNAKVSLELLPLLSRQLVVDAVKIDALQAQLVRSKDGSLNIDDLMPKEEKTSEQGAPMRFDIDGVTLTNSALSFRDEKAGAFYQISSLNLKTGDIAIGKETPVELAFHASVNQPKVELDAKLETRLTFGVNPQRLQLKDLGLSLKGAAAEFQKLDLNLKGGAEANPETGEMALSKINLAMTGVRAGENLELKLEVPQIKLTRQAVAGESVVARATLTGGQGVTTANFTVPKLSGDAQAFQAGPLAVELNVRRGENRLSAKVTAPLSGRFAPDSMAPTSINSNQANVELSGKVGGNDIQGNLTSPISIDVPDQRIDLSKMSTTLRIAGKDLPVKEIAAQLAGSAGLDLKQEQAALKVSGSFDQSKLQAQFGVRGFAKPAINFDAEVDQLNLNRYMRAEPKKQEKEEPFDFSALRDLNANGTLRVGALDFGDVKASQVALTIKAANGRVQVEPLAANLYQGRLAGAMTLNAQATPQIAIRQNLTGINVGPLLKDVAKKDVLEGKGNLSFDVAAQGATVSTIKQSLSGTAALKLQDGALKGINIAQSIRNAKAQIKASKGEATQSVNAAEQTDFAELSATFAIKNGIAHNDDLAMKSPLLRIGGAGDVNIPQEKLDYLLKATVVGTTKGQGGAELEALKGLTVPVKIHGPLTALDYKLDFSGLAAAAAQQQIEAKKEELKGKLTDKLQDRFLGKPQPAPDAQKTEEPKKSKESSEDKLKDTLKGIFK
jgi:AsmA protein